MAERTGRLVSPDAALRATVAFAVLMIVLRAALAPEAPMERLAQADNDDIMRLLSVRSWLAGQSWFDMTQYRVLAPEGLPMHWSRLVDLGIAALLWPLAQVFSVETAEAATVVLWPALLLMVLIVATARTGRALFGPWAAALAVLCLVFWPVTDHNYFRTGRIDHHNLQIVLSTLMLFGILSPARPVRAAVFSGLAAALSLAVGLEALPLIGLAGTVLLVRALAAPDRDGAQLLAFALTLASASAIFHAVQTAPGAWFVPVCDALGPPVLAHAAIAAAIAWGSLLAARRIAALPLRLAVAGAGAALGLAAVWPLLAPCLAGPYGDLPPELRELIAGRIVEARPAHRFALEGSAIFYRYVAPLAAAVPIAGLVWLRRTASGHADDREIRAAGTLLLFGGAALAATFLQVRMVVLAAPALPLLTGYALSALIEARARRAGAVGPTLALIAAGAATLFLPPLWLSVAPMFAGPAEAAAEAPRGSSHCRSPAHLRSLSALPQGTILAPVNQGAPILLLTGHDVVSAPYHRSAAALANGIFPFETDAAGLRTALTETGADYLLLCAGARYGDGTPIVNDLAAGGTVPWLTAVPGLHPDLRVFRATGS